MIKLHLTPEERNWVLRTLGEAIAACACTVNGRALVQDLTALGEWIRNAPNLEDGHTEARGEFVPGAGWGTNPHPNDDIHRQLTRAPHLPQVPTRLANAPAASEPGKIDITLPRVPGKSS